MPKSLGVLTSYVTVSPDVKLVPGTSAWYPIVDRATYANRTLAGREEHQRLQTEFTDNVEAQQIGGPPLEDPDTVVQSEPLIEGDELPEGGMPHPDGTGSVIEPPPQPPTDVPDTGGSSASGGAA